jgi:hypothetical protein
MDRGNEQRTGYRQWHDHPASDPTGNGPAHIFESCPGVAADFEAYFFFVAYEFLEPVFLFKFDVFWRGQIMVGRIAGALPAWDVFRFRDEVETGELIWLRLIDRHDGLFWFLQNIHDGFLLGLLKERGLALVARAWGRVVSGVIGFQCSVDPV